MELKPQFSNTNNWVNIGNGTVTAVKLATPIEAYNPIPPIVISTLVDVPTVACYTETEDAPASWISGGWLGANIVSGLTLGGNSDIEIGRYSLKRSKINLLRFPQLSSAYALTLYPPKWFKSITYTVWAYIGPGTADIEGKLDQIASTITP